MRICLLAGGTGGAKLASGFDALVAPGELTVIANTADDVEMWGLHVSPDVDAVILRLAGLFNDVAGYGVRDDTDAALEMMRRLGEPDWFRLGDRDLALHVLRTRLLREGMRLSEITLSICARLGLSNFVLPMSDDRVRTWFETDLGRLDFQDYFVRERTRPAVYGVGFEGLSEATASPEAMAALEQADLVVIGPSNPLISIEPILRLTSDNVRPPLTVAVSPIVGGVALKGPTVEMMRSTGRDPSPLGVAAEYAGRAGTFVLDIKDSDQAPAIEALGFRVVSLNTVMDGPDGARRLAAEIVSTVPGGTARDGVGGP